MKKKPYIVLPNFDKKKIYKVYELVRRPTLKLVREFDNLGEANLFALKHNNDDE